MNLASATEAFLVSFVLVAPFVAFLRPRVLSLTAGATLVALGALVVEFLAQDALSPLYASAVILVLVAPPVEELLKFFVSGATGANFASASGAGIGFAATENALYFVAAWGEPTALLVGFIALRAVDRPPPSRHGLDPDHRHLARPGLGTSCGYCPSHGMEHRSVDRDADRPGGRSRIDRRRDGFGGGNPRQPAAQSIGPGHARRPLADGPVDGGAASGGGGMMVRR